MSFYSAFPTSPLSRSALVSEANADNDPRSTFSPRVSKAYGQIASSTTSPLASRPPSASISPEDDRLASILSNASRPSIPHSSRHVSGPARLMRSPLAPAWSPVSNTPFDDSDAASPPLPSSSFTRSVNTRRRSSGFGISASSPTPNFGSLVGSFQESLLRGRMSMPASKPVIFDAEIGVLGMGKCRPSLRCPPHVHLKFPAHFYDFHAIDSPVSGPGAGSTAALGSPYVGTIDLEAHYHDMLVERKLAALSTGATSLDPVEPSTLPPFPGYAVPPKGQVQLIVKYPDLNAVKLFLVPYDLTDMQPGTKTFVRQKSTLISTSTSSSSDDSQPSSRSSPIHARQSTKEALRFAIHLQFCCPPLESRPHDHHAGFEGSDSSRFRHRSEAGQKKTSGKVCKSPKIFLHKSIRLVFGARALDSGEKLIDQIETPGQGAQRFATYSGPDEDWHQLHREVKAAERSAEQSRPASFSDLRVPSGSAAMQATHSGLGIDIQNPASHTARAAVDEAQADTNIQPLNSDPNGERWQSPSSQAGAEARAGGPSLSSAATWSLRSEASSSESSSAGRWPGPAHRPGHDDVQQLARSLASSRLSEAYRTLRVLAASASASPNSAFTAGNSGVRRAADGSEAKSADAALPRPSRIRSASTASLSEARVQSVSALGRLEEPSAASAQSRGSTSADSPFAKRSSRAAKKVGADRPSLIRKLSEQMARSHTPSPHTSPKLRPAWRPAGGEPAETALDGLTDPDGDASDDSHDHRMTPLEEAAMQRSTGSIR